MLGGQLTDLVRTGPYFRLQVIGTLLPGAIIACEFWLLFSWDGDENILKAASEQTAGVNYAIAAMAIFVGLFVAYSIGFMAKNIVWSVWWALVSTPVAMDPKVLKQLGDAYGEQRIDAVLAQHPALEESVTAHEGTRQGALAYCKLWLQLREPKLAIDYLEPEINLLLGLIAPTALLVPIALKMTELWPFALVVVAAFIYAFVQSARYRQRSELERAFQHFLLAHWYDDAARPPPPRQDSAPAS
jgi:hypothetical protein